MNVWLINTGWSGGEYGVGKRIKLKYTRTMIQASIDNRLINVKYIKVTAFVLSTFFIGCAGAIWADYLTYVRPNIFLIIWHFELELL